MSHILSRVIRHVDDKSIDLRFRYEEAVQLRKTAESLSEAIANELGIPAGNESVLYIQPSLLAALSMAYSTQLTLHERYACSGFEGTVNEGLGSPELLELQTMAVSGIKQVSEATLQLANYIRNAADMYGTCIVSPFLDALYQAGVNFAWMAAEAGGGKHSEKLTAMMDTLQLLGKTWHSASKSSSGGQSIQNTYLHDQPRRVFGND